jgi:hypothetical protein
MALQQPIIAWDYAFAPNAQKSRLYLYLTKTPFSICEQPFVLPRPDLTALGITYRRVPVLSIGKDVFPDNASFLAAMQELLREEGKGRQLRESIWDGACDAWGYVSVFIFSCLLWWKIRLGCELNVFANDFVRSRGLTGTNESQNKQRSFWIALACLDPDFLSEELAKDRADLFPVFARKDFGQLQNSARSEFRAFLEGAEGGFLKDGEGPFVGGEKEPGMADVHAVWMVKWVGDGFAGTPRGEGIADRALVRLMFVLSTSLENWTMPLVVGAEMGTRPQAMIATKPTT